MYMDGMEKGKEGPGWKIPKLPFKFSNMVVNIEENLAAKAAKNYCLSTASHL